MPWAEAIQPKALCLHLNFHGEASLTFSKGRVIELKPQTLLWCRGVQAATRTHSRDRHECLTLVYPDPWLTETLRDISAQLPPARRRLVSATPAAFAEPGRALTGEDLAWARALVAPHLCEAARRLLDTARLTDFLLRELFHSAAAGEAAKPLISRSERASRERIDRVKNEIQRHLDQNHNLESLAAAAGCSPHHLSRTFAQVTGISLMLWIRRARVERAAELIASGRCNVSEAALEVGYHSFSHFSRAFCQEKGVPPSKWIGHLANSTPQPRP